MPRAITLASLTVAASLLLMFTGQNLPSLALPIQEEESHPTADLHGGLSTCSSHLFGCWGDSSRRDI